MINRLFSKIMTYDLDKSNNDFVDQSLFLVNRYLLFLFLLFLFYSIFIISFFGDVFSSTFLIVITFFWLFIFWIKEKMTIYTSLLKGSYIIVFIVLTFIVSFFYIYTWRNAGVEYFYFSLLFAIPFFFNYKEDYYFILLIVAIIAINFIGCLYFELDFLPKSKFIKANDFKLIQLLNIIFAITTFLIDIYFVSQKDRLIYGLIRQTKRQDSTIEDLLKYNHDLMIQQIVVNNLTEDNISEIIGLAESNSPIFLEKFQIYFPEFIPSVLKINPSVVHSELHICALMKLNFDTKKIASCVNSSVRAVESRKYRIRKKLGIASDININNFILKI